jgi:hypothetical protein
MNNALIKKTVYLTNAGSAEDLAFTDYKSIDSKSLIADVNSTRVRGSVRLATNQIILPSDVEKDRRTVLGFTFK